MKRSSNSPAKAQVKIVYCNLNSEYNVNQECDVFHPVVHIQLKNNQIQSNTTIY
jgi:hypothetical protein